MKKRFFYLTLGAAMLASCTSEEVVDEGVYGNAIGFENVVAKGTRDVANGEDLTNDNFDNFFVYGYYTLPDLQAEAVSVFNGKDVIKSNGVWTYEDTRYWVPGATYYFYAYSCGDIKLNNSFGCFTMDATQSEQKNRVLKIADYICDDTHQHDLVYACKENIVGKDKSTQEGVVANDKVAFHFEHILTKVNARFTSELPGEYTLLIKNVRIQNIRNQGDYIPKTQVTDASWYNVDRWPENRTEDPVVSLLGRTDMLNVTSATPQTSKQAFVIPYSYAKGDVMLKFDLEVQKDGQKVMTRNLSGTWRPNWVQGYKYTYNVKITGSVANLEAIEFTTVTDDDGNVISGWGNGSDVDITFSAN